MQTYCPFHAPTDSASGRYPSLRLRSNLRISSIDLALAIAALTLSRSPPVIRRPAFPETGIGLGSSMVRADFADCVVTDVDSVVASCVIRPSGVTNNFFAASRS